MEEQCDNSQKIYDIRTKDGVFMAKMTIYERHELADFISVEKLISVHRANLNGRKLSGEAHNFPELIYIQDGVLDISVDGKQFSLSSGQCIFYPPCSYHIALTCSCASVNIIGFESSSLPLSEFYDRIITLNDKQKAMLSEIVTIGIRSFKTAPVGINMVPRKTANALTLHKLKNKIELLLIDLYEMITSESTPVYKNYKLQQFEEIIRYLRTNVDKSLTIENIAKNCGISVSKLKMLFAEQSDLSPMAYFISLKIDKAKELIRETSLNFTQISEMLGFKTVYYFSNRFKQKTGMSPSEYAKKSSF